MKTKLVPITLRLGDAEWSKLVRISQALGLKPSAVLRGMITDGLPRAMADAVAKIVADAKAQAPPDSPVMGHDLHTYVRLLFGLSPTEAKDLVFPPKPAQNS